MTAQMILAPLVAQAALTFYLMAGMMLLRRRAVMEKKVKPKDLLIRAGGNPWPPRVAQFGDAYLNSFELPILFYVVMILAFITRTADLLFVLLAWVFVALRVTQAIVHTTSNIRKYRSNAFRAGAAVLLAMWVLFAIRFFLA